MYNVPMILGSEWYDFREENDVRFFHNSNKSFLAIFWFEKKKIIDGQTQKDKWKDLWMDRQNQLPTLHWWTISSVFMARNKSYR